MNILNIVIAAFALLGALDRMLDNRFGLGEEFERGLHLFGSLALSMIGMIVMVPLISELMAPMLSFCHEALHIEPSIIPTSLIANDMGGAALAVQVAADPALGMFNGLVVSCMMGGTIAFTIPVSLTSVDKRHHRELLLGMLCGIVTIPVGCLAGGLLAGIPVVSLMGNLLPLIVFSAVIAAGLALCPDLCARIFSALGVFIKVLITVGLALSILRYLTGVEIIPGLTTLEDAAAVSLSCSIFLTGVLPMLALLSRVIGKPMRLLSRSLAVNEHSVMGFVATLASSVTTFAMMDKMDKKGILLNSAFAISAAFAFADHLAFTMSFNAAYVGPVTLAKLVGGVTSVFLGCVLYNRLYGKDAS